MVSGHRFYRLVVDGEEPAEIEVEDVRFSLHGARNHRNADRVVQLYEYLLAGARQARLRTVSPDLDVADATVDGETIGPFALRVSDSAALTVSGVHELVDADGAVLGSPIASGQPFYVRSAPGSSAATITATVPGTENGVGGRVLTGVARDELAGSFTPVALTVPTKLVVDFDIRWDPTSLSSGPRIQSGFSIR